MLFYLDLYGTNSQLSYKGTNKQENRKIKLHLSPLFLIKFFRVFKDVLESV